MTALLDPLRLYDLSEGSHIFRELQAYAAGLELFRQRLERCRDDLFLATCSLERLARWEELLDLPVARSGEGDFTPEGIRRSLLAAGLEAALQEEFSRRLIRVTDARIIGGYQTLDEVKQQVRRMLPAHLEVEFDIGILTWEMFEGFGLDFAAWDRRDFTWEWFDLNGDKLGGE